MSDRAVSPKRVLVTGSTGAIGQPLSRYLMARGHTVRGLARRPTPGLTDFVVGDLADRDAVRTAVDVCWSYSATKRHEGARTR